MHVTPAVSGAQVCEAGAGAHPGKKREVEDSSKKLGALFWKMNKGGWGVDGIVVVGFVGVGVGSV